MLIGKVIGTIWATRKYETITGFKMQFVQPLNAEMENIGEPFVALDTIGAGPGELIFYATSSEAVIPLHVEMAPVDASIVGIIDSINTEKSYS
ncbi:MAG: EutN/CcmL family microcompartment protein [Melioribacteraceae bacterium]|nr:EutN/CcmL family microcompartment protein [Melioribacteraceae bacterium]